MFHWILVVPYSIETPELVATQKEISVQKIRAVTTARV
jgi:hypothetical protein